jgi:ankyrin repeat domain-containing protein 50
MSSAIDDSRERKDYINENHINMCRFKGRDDPGYLKVQQVISKILEDVRTDAVEPRCT